MTDPHNRDETAQPDKAARSGPAHSKPTEQNRDARPSGSQSGASAGSRESERAFVVRDRRRKPSPRPRPDGAQRNGNGSDDRPDPERNRPGRTEAGSASGSGAPQQPNRGSATPGHPTGSSSGGDPGRTAGRGGGAPTGRPDAGRTTAGRAASATGPARDTREEPAGDGSKARHAQPEQGQAKPGAGTFAAELQAVRSELEDRTRDLQRVTAEYANYRRRVERDRALAGEQATAAVLTELLGVLDDLDRARDHGDLVGPFGAVAEQLVSVLTKVGLSPFAEPGDAFDPSRHEAVAHSLSGEVTEPTCVQVFRRGYQFGERLLRPAMVAVAEPSEEPEPAEAAGEAGPETDTEAVEVDPVEAEVVNGDVVDPEAAAVASDDQDTDDTDVSDRDADGRDADGDSAGRESGQNRSGRNRSGPSDEDD